MPRKFQNFKLKKSASKVQKIMGRIYTTWFKYRGNRQFGPFFGAKFDPKSNKHHVIVCC